MDQRVVYNLQEAGPEQINNIQGHLNNIRQQRMVLERNLVRNRWRKHTHMQLADTYVKQA